jgi:hypothetical protein
VRGLTGVVGHGSTRAHRTADYPGLYERLHRRLLPRGGSDAEGGGAVNYALYGLHRGSSVDAERLTARAVRAEQERQPALAAKQLASLDVLSGGRLDVEIDELIEHARSELIHA